MIEDENALEQFPTDYELVEVDVASVKEVVL